MRNSTSTEAIVDCEPGKLCPMCEAAFPGDVDPEAFESHVVEHFCFEEAETIKYVEQDDPNNRPLSTNSAESADELFWAYTKAKAAW